MSEPDQCPRCGHGVRHDLRGADAVRRAVPGMKPTRQQCAELDVDGWPCQCRSRWHVGVPAR